MNIKESWGKEMDGQKWKMKQKLMSRKNCVNLIEGFSTDFY